MIRVASVFSQLLTVFSRWEFQRAVQQHGAERYAKGFACWDQFVAMMFCQLAQARSLREICAGLKSTVGKLQHLGLRAAPARSTLAYANEHRPWPLFRTVFEQLLGRCQEVARGRKRFRFRNRLYSLDSTVIELCASLFDWAKFRQRKGAVKLHLLLDHEGYLPTFAVMTDGLTADVKIARQLALPADSIVVVDRGYVDYELFGRWTAQGVWFVTRLKEGAAFHSLAQRPVLAERGILTDQEIEWADPEARRRCPSRLRRIAYLDEEGHRWVYLTNHLGFAATTITQIYKERWQIELLFKALKQNLRIKTFVGTSANALQIQVWTALIALLLLKYLQFRSRLDWSLSNLVALLRWNLFTYRDLWLWLDDPYILPQEMPIADQLPLLVPGQQP